MKKSEFFAQKKQFFVNDVAAVKDYVLTHCAQDQIDKIIARADEACAQSFRFDLRWDMEYTEIPVVFEKEINWRMIRNGSSRLTVIISGSQWDRRMC